MTSAGIAQRRRALTQEYELAPEILRRVNAYLTRDERTLKRGSIVDATIIVAPRSTKNAAAERDPEMHSTKKRNPWHVGMKAHIGVDADSALVHKVTTTSGKRGRIKALVEGREKRALEKNDKAKASGRAKVGHPFRVIMRQFGLIKVRFRGLAKNTAQVITPFALSNPWMARRRLMAMTGWLRPQQPKRRDPEAKPRRETRKPRFNHWRCRRERASKPGIDR